MKYWIIILLTVLFMVGGCSNFDEPKVNNSVEENIERVDSNHYYYDGIIALENGDKGETVYVIRRGPMMFPVLYGKIIPIPLLDYNTESIVEIDLGDNTLIEENSVIYTSEGKEITDNLPLEGERVYSKYLSIQRISKDVIKVRMEGDPENHVRILSTPLPLQVYDYNEGRFKDRFAPHDYNLPDTVPVVLIPQMFLDTYRPIRQYRMTLY